MCFILSFFTLVYAQNPKDQLPLEQKFGPKQSYLNTVEEKTNPVFTTLSMNEEEEKSDTSDENSKNKDAKSKKSERKRDPMKDVYSQKPVEYLEAISKGLDPVWDSELKKYTYDDPNAKTNSTVDMSKTTNTPDPQANQKVDEDLPF